MTPHHCKKPGSQHGLPGFLIVDNIFINSAAELKRSNLESYTFASVSPNRSLSRQRSCGYLWEKGSFCLASHLFLLRFFLLAGLLCWLRTFQARLISLPQRRSTRFGVHLSACAIAMSEGPCSGSSSCCCLSVSS